VALCGGKNETNTQDKEYNAKMAAIAERQQNMAEEYMSFWRDEYKPFESAQLAANKQMLPYLTNQQISEAQLAEATAKGMLAPDGSGQTLLGLQQDTMRKELEFTQNRLAVSDSLLGRQAEVARMAYDEAISGVDVNRDVNQARADVANSFAGADAAMRRDASRMGLSTNSAGYANAMAGLARDRAKGMAGAMTTARTSAQDRNFTRLTSAAGMGLGKV
jgi:hypothetical protein